MSLKQLLLCYNPRKLALSRQFSSLFNDTNNNPEEEKEMTTSKVSINVKKLEAHEFSGKNNKPTKEEVHIEQAWLQRLNEFPALRIAVVGPPYSGQTRLAKSLSKRLKLQYFSIATAIEKALTRKKERNIIKAQSEQENVSFAFTFSPEQQEEENIFSNVELDTLFSGQALPKAKSMEILLYYLSKTIASGYGVVIDGIYPVELQQAQIEIDYLVTLVCSKEDARQNIEAMKLDTFQVKPGLFFSKREQAIVARIAAGNTGGTSTLSDLGFEDSIEEQMTEETQMETGSTMKVLAKSKEEEEQEEEENNDGETVETSVNEEQEKDPSKSQEVPVQWTQAESNEIVLVQGDLVPINKVLLGTFDERYNEYLLKNETIDSSIYTYHQIHVLTNQSLRIQVDQCMIEISGVSSTSHTIIE
jgi:hypothetical protein